MAEVWPADARWDYQYERAAAPGRSWRAAAWRCRLKCIPSPLPGTQRASIGSVKLPQDAGLGEAGGILGGMAGWRNDKVPAGKMDSCEALRSAEFQSFSGRKKNAIPSMPYTASSIAPSSQLDSPSRETRAEIMEAAVRAMSSS